MFMSFSLPENPFWYDLTNFSYFNYLLQQNDIEEENDDISGKALWIQPKEELKKLERVTN